MNKFILGVAALSLPALLVTSCAQETVETKGDGMIRYGVATGKQTLGKTRAEEIGITNLESTGFTVEAYYSAGGAFRNFALEYGGSLWSYDSGDEIYHPTGNLSHYAVYPEGKVTIASSGPEATFTYTTDAETDLIAAADETQNTSQNDATANLTFKHLMSQVRFAVTGLDPLEHPNLLINVSPITLDNIDNGGTYTLSNGNSGSWLLDGNKVGYPYALSVAAPESDYIFEGAPVGLMLMPQGFENDAADGSFSFDFTMTDIRDGATVGQGTVTVPFGDSVLNTPEWMAGTRYLYVINFEAPNVIRFTVERVEEWIENDPIDVDVNNNPGVEGGDFTPVP